MISIFHTPLASVRDIRVEVLLPEKRDLAMGTAWAEGLKLWDVACSDIFIHSSCCNDLTFKLC